MEEARAEENVGGSKALDLDISSRKTIVSVLRERDASTSTTTSSRGNDKFSRPQRAPCGSFQRPDSTSAFYVESAAG